MFEFSIEALDLASLYRLDEFSKLALEGTKLTLGQTLELITIIDGICNVDLFELTNEELEQAFIEYAEQWNDFLKSHFDGQRRD